jgi:protease-4
MRRLLIVFVLLVVLAIGIALVGIFLSTGRPPVLGGSRVLTWKLDAPLVDYSETPDLQLFRRRSPQGLASLHRLLVQARNDPDVKGLGIYIQSTHFGFGKAQELRSLLRSFAAAEKFVDCYLETAGEGTNGTLAYYLASACQRITLSPLGELNTVGIYSDSPFIRGTLDKLQIEPQFLHIGDYKSAAEFFTETQHSTAAAEALGAVLDDLFDQIVAAIAESRELDPEKVRRLIDASPLPAEQALEEGLIDEITYPDIFESRLTDQTTNASPLVALEDYLPVAATFGAERIAVVFAQGTIVRGGNGTDPWSQQRFVGADSVRQILRHLSDDDEVRGVVLRVDSPGGSPVASDLILRELELLAEKKPLVVSMSDVAASGGYYISAKAAKIVAEPATITGSIGVVGGKLATRRFQQELLGISHDTLSRGANADFYSSLDPFSPQQAEQFLASMQRVYETFIGHVAAGRDLSTEDVESIAGGRIWTGRQALEIGLVDEIGGLEHAVMLVKEAAGLAPDTVIDLDFHPRPPNLLELLSRTLTPFLETRTPHFPLMPDLRTPFALELPAEVVGLFRPS